MIFWSLREPTSSLRGLGLNLLNRFTYARKFSSLDMIVDLICYLLETYNTPLLNTVLSSILALL